MQHHSLSKSDSTGQTSSNLGLMDTGKNKHKSAYTQTHTDTHICSSLQDWNQKIKHKHWCKEWLKDCAKHNLLGLTKSQYDVNFHEAIFLGNFLICIYVNRASAFNGSLAQLRHKRHWQRAFKMFFSYSYTITVLRWLYTKWQLWLQNDLSLVIAKWHLHPYLMSNNIFSI